MTKKEYLGELNCLRIITSFLDIKPTNSDLRRCISQNSDKTGFGKIEAMLGALMLSARPIALKTDDFTQVELPCVLKWGADDYALLVRIKRKPLQETELTLFSPTRGKFKIPLSKAPEHFQGIALEISRNIPIAPQPKPQEKFEIRTFFGKISGLRRFLLQVFVVALAYELFALAMPLLNQLVIDDAVSTHDHDLLTTLIIGFALLLITQTAIGMARSWMITVMGQSIGLQWSSHIFNHLVRLPVWYFHQRHLGDVISRFGSVHSIQHTLTTSVIEGALDGLMAITALMMMIFYAPMLAAVTVSAVILYALLRWFAYNPFREASSKRMEASAKEQSYFIETIRAITPIKLFGRENQRSGHWKSLLVDVYNLDLKTHKLSIGFNAANSCIYGLENLAIFWIGGKMIMGNAGNGLMMGGSGGLFTVGMLFAFVGYKSQFTSRANALINYASEIKMLGLHAERLSDIASTEAEKSATPNNKISHIKTRIELRNVSFRYSEDGPWILKNINLVVEQGECLVITGLSGSGKSTLLKILLGLINPTEGSIFYGGFPVQELGLQNYRNVVGTVMQEDMLLSGSIEENISFFGSSPKHGRIERSAMMASIHEDIVAMPMGYQTLVGDMGSSLSGGQRQRVLLARALYKEPRILALDEATSHLDGVNESRVMGMLAQAKMTVIMVTHRPEALQRASKIVQVAEGQLRELPGSGPEEPSEAAAVTPLHRQA